MACCILTAVIMNQLIKTCDALDLRFLKIQYNDTEGDACAAAESEDQSITETCHITIAGMTCSACTSSIIEALENLDGVFRASVSLALGRATVSYDTKLTTPANLLVAVEKAGYHATPGDRSSRDLIDRLRQSNELRDVKKAISSASIFSSIIVGLDRLSLTFAKNTRIQHLMNWMILVLACRVQVWDAWSFHSRAWRRPAKQIATMDTLLSLSLLLGLIVSFLKFGFSNFSHVTAYPSSGPFLTVVILGGKYLETVLRRESNAHLAALYELQNDNAVYRFHNSDVSVPASLLQKGDDIVIPPQAVIPCDCFLVDGSSAVDESSITGESIPVIKNVGDFLLAGTKNLSRQLRAVVSQDQTESSLARIIKGVAVATEQRIDGSEPFTVLTKYFVSLVLCLAGVTFLITFKNREFGPVLPCFTGACERAATILAAACPCAIGLATPSAVMAGIDVAYSQGTLISGGIRTMQALSKATHVVMDKTGTLTQGRLQVADHYFVDDLKLNRNMCYRLLAAAEVEEARFHPVAKAVFKWAFSRVHGSTYTRAVAESRNTVRTLGQGIRCQVKGHSDEWITVHIGNASFFTDSNISISTDSHEDHISGSLVHFAFAERYAGFVLVRDTVRHEAPAVISSLLENDIKVSMLTGDDSLEAARISAELSDIPVLASRALPEDKLHIIRSLQGEGHKVVMVGDGINDVLAQTAADVGISIALTQGCLTGAGGVVIVSGNLMSLISLLQVSKQVTKQARINAGWALLYNAVALSLAVGVWESWGWKITANQAGMLMAGSSSSVMCMSLWLRWRLREHAVRLRRI